MVWCEVCQREATHIVGKEAYCTAHYEKYVAKKEPEVPAVINRKEQKRKNKEKAKQVRGK